MTTTTFRKYPPPVAALMLRRSSFGKASLVRLVFLDMVFRDLIEIDVRKASNVKLGKDVPHYYVKLTEAGKRYSPKPWEQPLITVLERMPDSDLHLPSFVKAVYQRIAGYTQYFRSIIREPEFAPLFREGFWDRLLGGFSLTDSGEKAHQAMAQELHAIERQILADATLNRNAAKAVVQTLGGYALLISGLDFTLLPFEFPAQMVQEEQTQPTGASVDGGVGCSSCSGDSDIWGGVSDAFDGGHGSGCSSHGGGDSGCGGDSGGDGGGDGGCGGGGCSGCGGGCGGD